MLKHLSRNNILNAVAFEKDVDVLSDESRKKFRKGRLLSSPPAGAVLEFLKIAKKPLENPRLSWWAGMLVGEPVAMLLKQKAKKIIICDQKQKISQETKKPIF